MHWKRGAVLGTGAFCTCYQARDFRTGTLMAVKQVAVDYVIISITAALFLTGLFLAFSS